MAKTSSKTNKKRLLCWSLALQSQEHSWENCSILPAFGESGCSPLVLMSVASLEVSACVNVTQMLYESLIVPLFTLSCGAVLFWRPPSHPKRFFSWEGKPFSHSSLTQELIIFCTVTIPQQKLNGKTRLWTERRKFLVKLRFCVLSVSSKDLEVVTYFSQTKKSHPEVTFIHVLCFWESLNPHVWLQVVDSQLG